MNSISNSVIKLFRSTGVEMHPMHKWVVDHTPHWSKKTYIIGAISIVAIASAAYFYSRLGLPLPSTTSSPDVPSIPDPVSLKNQCPVISSEWLTRHCEPHRSAPKFMVNRATATPVLALPSLYTADKLVAYAPASPNIYSAEAVAKLHGSEKSMVLGHLSKSKSCPNCTADGLPKRAGGKALPPDALKGRFCKTLSFANDSRVSRFFQSFDWIAGSHESIESVPQIKAVASDSLLQDQFIFKSLGINRTPTSNELVIICSGQQVSSIMLKLQISAVTLGVTAAISMLARMMATVMIPRDRLRTAWNNVHWRADIYDYTERYPLPPPGWIPPWLGGAAINLASQGFDQLTKQPLPVSVPGPTDSLAAGAAVSSSAPVAPSEPADAVRFYFKMYETNRQPHNLFRAWNILRMSQKLNEEEVRAPDFADRNPALVKIIENELRQYLKTASRLIPSRSQRSKTVARQKEATTLFARFRDTADVPILFRAWNLIQIGQRNPLPEKPDEVFDLCSRNPHLHEVVQSVVMKYLEMSQTL